MKGIAILSIIALFVFSLSLGLSGVGPFVLSSLSPQGVIDPETIYNDQETPSSYGVFHMREVSLPVSVSQLLASGPVYADVLGVSSEEKRIEIDLTNQKLYAYEGDKRVYEFLVSTGLWGRTPTGEFRIWTKLKSTRMQGGSKALGTYYNLPNVPYTMFFSNEKIPASRGYGIHGAYWHNNFGHPMSHGCINMKPDEAKQVYYWATPDLQGKASMRATKENPGTRIVIYGTAPKS